MKTPPPERLLVSIPEAGEMLGIGKTKAYELVNRGEWPYVKIGRMRRISVEFLRRWSHEKQEGRYYLR